MAEVAAKKGWTQVAFGDVVQLSKERSRDPEGDGLERYVGLEHLGPSDLKIRRWGNVVDGTTFTTVFRPGQVLFGKRRAYQRKVAVAEFSGVCSGDIYVLEPKNEHLLPELLPFMCQTDGFFEHAIRTSAGSLSPRTNWKSLATFEFALPPIEEQRRIVEALVALDREIDFLRATSAHLETIEMAVVAECLQLEGAVETTVGAAFQLQIGRQRAPKYALGNNPCPYLRAANIKDGRLLLEEVFEMDFDARSRRTFGLRRGDVLITEGCGSPEELGATARWDGELPGDVCFQNTLIRLRPRKGVTTAEFAYAWARYAYLSRQFLRIARGSNILHIGSRRLEAMPIQLPPLKTQEDLAKSLAVCETGLKSVGRRVTALWLLRRDLLGGTLGKTHD